MPSPQGMTPDNHPLPPPPQKKNIGHSHYYKKKKSFLRKRLFKIYEKPSVNFDFEINDVFGKRNIFVNASGLIVPLCAVGEFKVWILYGWSLWRHQVTKKLHSCNVYVHLSILLQRSCRSFNNMHVYLRYRKKDRNYLIIFCMKFWKNRHVWTRFE